MDHVIKTSSLTVTVSDAGAELRSVVGADGFEYIWDGKEEFWGGRSPVLFPACGRTLDNKYTLGGNTYEMLPHGFAMRSDFKVAKKETDRLTLVLEANSETQKNYPFDFALTADFKVEGNQLNVNFTVQNKGKSTMPYMLGWHPGFMLEDKNGSSIGDFSVRFNGTKKVTWYPLQNGCFVRPFGEDYAIPTGAYVLNEEEIYSNDTMIFTATGEKALLSSDKESHGIDFSWSENLPYFCIWKADSSKARFICLEPWSDVPGGGDAPENFDTKKMSRLAGGESATYTYKVKFLA